jgi:hypothetical protein
VVGCERSARQQRSAAQRSAAQLSVMRSLHVRGALYRCAHASSYGTRSPQYTREGSYHIFIFPGRRARARAENNAKQQCHFKIRATRRD